MPNRDQGREIGQISDRDLSLYALLSTQAILQSMKEGFEKETRTIIEGQASRDGGGERAE